MTAKKLRAVGVPYRWITNGKLYAVVGHDEDGDYIIRDDDGDVYTVEKRLVGDGKDWKEEDTFVWEDLQTGDVLVTREGKKAVYFREFQDKQDVFLYATTVDGGWDERVNYNDTLEHTVYDDMTIVEVYRPSGIWDCYLKTKSLNKHKCVFKRNDRKKMTVEDIEAALGYKIEVVDNE